MKDGVESVDKKMARFLSLISRESYRVIPLSSS